MDASTIAILIALLVIDVFLIAKDIRNKLIFSGSKKFKMVIPVMIVIFIALTLRNSNFRLQDIIMCIEMFPLTFVGNRNGITEKGFIFNSYVTPWDKVQGYSLEDLGDKYIVTYEANIGIKRIIFKQEDKDEVKKYLLGIKKLRYIRK
jgi:hypothetical protein